jgi:alkaline phosphatase D
MTVTRRSFLRVAAPLGLLPLLPGCGSGDDDTEVSGGTTFLSGVASGDPTSERVILWTRVTPTDSALPVSVQYVVATDPELSAVVASGDVLTSADVDYTVKVDVTGLAPGSTYHYRFSVLGEHSPVGRTKTLPTGQVPRLRLAVASCANYPHGFFNAYGLIAARSDLDLVLHLGDYIYEYANGDYGDGTALGRVPDPSHEAISLEDYRRRYAQYRKDPDLQEAHRQHPFCAVWDDHETADNSYRDGALNHQPELEGEWAARKSAAIQAYREWMPVRDPEQGGPERIYRSFAIGDLVDLIMLDTRLIGRDQQVADPCDAAQIDAPERSLLGAPQEAWLSDQLIASVERGTRWRLLGQQVMFGQVENVLLQPVCVFSTDQWDGYAASRARLLDVLREGAIDNVVILTGDIHSSWAVDITANPFDRASYDPSTGAGSVAVELVAPAVTSPGIEDPGQATQYSGLIAATHPHVKFVDVFHRGYLLLDVSHERVQAQWYHVRTLDIRSAQEDLAATFETLAGTNHLSSVPPA